MDRALLLVLAALLTADGERLRGEAELEVLLFESGNLRRDDDLVIGFADVGGGKGA